MKKKPAKAKAPKPAPRKKKAAKRPPTASKPPAKKPAKKPAAAVVGRKLDKRAAFLAAYSICASIRHAAKAAHVSRARHYEWLAEEGYRARFKQAQVEAAQSLEDEATYRAMVGVFEPNVYQGRWLYPQEEYEVEPAKLDRRGRVITPARTAWRDIPGSKPLGLWKKSDVLLAMRLRGEMPDKYRQFGSMELTGPNGGPIEIVERLQAARARVRAATEASAPETPADDGNPPNYRN